MSANHVATRIAMVLLLTVASAIAAKPGSAVQSAKLADKQSTKQPNVVIFLTDDQGTLDANCYGSKDLYTPTIDKLAATGVRFTQAYAHMVCCPARAALLTGRHPQRSGVNFWTQGNLHSKRGINMALEELTLAEAFKALGYRTALFGKWHLGAHRDFGPTKQGFDAFFGIRGGFVDNNNHFFLHGKGYHDLYEGTKEVVAKDRYLPDMVAERSLAFLDANKDRPFFLYVALNTPHYPEQPPAEDQKRFEKLEQPRRSYAAFMATTDRMMGKVVDKLEALELRDDTVIVFMSDNGHSAETNHIRFDDHKSGLPKGHKYGANGGGGNTGKWRGHKGNLLEGGIRVPAVISYPAKLPKGVVRDQAITIMDWYPTLLELCGGKPTTELDGKSVLPLIKSPNEPTRHPVLHFQWHMTWAVRQGNWKLLGRWDKNKNANVAMALYKLTDDKPEATNYAKSNGEIVKRLLSLHEQWVRDVTPKPTK